MRGKRDITAEEFDSLLLWLGPDREGGGRKYEEIRHALIKIFTCRGCPEADRLADETINRVVGKVGEVAQTYVGDPAIYFYGVARNVFLEYQRERPAPAPLPALRAAEEIEGDDHPFECLEECMQKLAPDSRALILEYYTEEDAPKIDHRKHLARRLDIALNALRIRAHRIRSSLKDCMINCLERRAGR